MDQKNNILGSCVPTVFTAHIEHAGTINGGTNRFIIQTVHLGGSRFIILYANNVIEIKNLVDYSNPITEESIELMDNDSNGMATDLDYHIDETRLVVAF